jgi:superfamily I DNA and/or RNA helicase
VDKFQCQEAPAVILSMCASSVDECPRGADFLRNKNRIDVAVSRAQCSAIAVGCPAPRTARSKTVEHME